MADVASVSQAPAIYMYGAITTAARPHAHATSTHYVPPGFAFPFTGFKAGSEYHNFHHTENSGNYAGSPFWDYLFNTNTAVLRWFCMQR